MLLLSGLAPSDSDASAPVSIRDTATLDPATGTWKRAAPMNTAADIPTVVPLNDGRVMVLQDGFSGAEIYDPASDVWTITSPANGKFSQVTAVKLPDGIVLVTGGASEDDNTDDTLPIAEIYDPYADTWTVTGPMNEMRIHHTLTLLPSGQVIAIGGVGATFTEPLATSGIYDPVTNTWRPGPEIAEGRYEHTATLLSDGRILIFGGIKLNKDETEIEVTSSHEILEAIAGWSVAGVTLAI